MIISFSVQHNITLHECLNQESRIVIRFEVKQANTQSRTSAFLLAAFIDAMTTVVIMSMTKLFLDIRSSVND